MKTLNTEYINCYILPLKVIINLFQIPQMKMAMEVAKNKPVKFYGSSWSSPTWLKTNHQYNHGGTLLEGPGSMTWKTYANYLVK